jgi:biotin carboxylase
MFTTPSHQAVEYPSFKHSDILYRKHFGSKPSLTRSYQSLEGLEGSWVPMQRKDSMIPHEGDEAVIVVDCFSTGAMVGHEALERGFQVINIQSFDNPELAALVPSNCRSDYYSKIVYNEGAIPESSLQLLVEKLKKLQLNIVCVVAGAETGVELADRLSEKLVQGGNQRVKSNGSADTESRRNKYAMGEQVRGAGIRAVMQRKATTWGEIKEFLELWKPSPYNAIVKPMESAGSDDVTLCHSEAEVQKAFGNIMGKVNSLGCVNEGVLVQEYLSGIEYVVDTVSLNGVHKCVALWEYDRRPTNGAGFVLHGQRLMDGNEARAQDLITYMFTVLDALNIKNGPGHGEVKWFNGAPCLVEVGSRCHGAEGMWMGIASEVFKINQVSATIDAFTNANHFLDDELIPVTPVTRYAFGAAKYMITYKNGTFDKYDETLLAEIKAMPSFRDIETFLKPGKPCRPTIDCFTWGGCVLLANVDEQQLNEDYARIEEICTIGKLYHLEAGSSGVEATAQQAKKAVIVVDPFTTGAVLAHECESRGYAVICVYSAMLSQIQNLASLVPKDLELHFTAIIGQLEGLADEKAALYTAGEVMKVSADQNLDIVACVAGAETGVQLCDRLAEKLGLRGNGSAGTEARRNKYAMSEKLREYINPLSPDVPTRAVKQIKVTSVSDALENWLAEHNPTPFKVIVKPVESAGSDDVKACFSKDEVRAHCSFIIGKENHLGNINEGVLVQEWLEGTEYVVDTVSRDGVVKVVAIWEYHKEAVNGHTAPLVYFGQRSLVPSTAPNSDELYKVVAYQKVVLQALGIVNGPSHSEIKVVDGEPCLIEVGARCHGAEGCWRQVAIEAHGWDQVTATADAYLDVKAFDLTPDLVRAEHLKFPRIAFLVSFETGVLKEVNPKHLLEIQGFKSFRAMEVFVHPGQTVLPTTDCFTFLGNVRLCHEDEDAVTKDYERIRVLEKSGLLIFEKN